MIHLRDIRLQPKLIVTMLLVSLIPLVIVAWWAKHSAAEALLHQSYAQLETMREIKRVQIERFFHEREVDMGGLVETIGTLRQQGFDKLEAVRETKRSSVMRYLQTIKDQIETFSENRMVIDSMQAFSSDFKTFREENNVDNFALQRQRESLWRYYEQEFMAEYQQRNEGAATAMRELFNRLDEDVIALQYEYIQANQHPLGSKHLLD